MNKLITSPENILYLSGFTGSFGQILLTGNKKYLFTDFRYLLRAKKESQDFIIKDIKEAKPIFREHKIIYFEKNHLTFLKLENLRSIYPNIDFRPMDIDIDRSIKTDKEIALIKKAANIGNKIYRDLIKYIRIGVTELDLVSKIHVLLYKYGATDVSFKPIVAFGKNTATPHHESTIKKLNEGESVLLDFGVKYKGYCSDMTRMVFTSNPTSKMKEIYNIVKTAQLKGLNSIKPGIKISDIDKTAREYIENKGYGKYFGHALGHGVGIEIHENPSISYKNDVTLKENMVITIEPGIYIENFGGVRIEDLVVVKRTGAMILTKISKNIKII